MNMTAAIEIPLMMFEQSGDPEAEIGQKAQKTEPGPGKIYCHLCNHLITDHAHRTERDGSFMHQRTNPSGFVFEFGCFIEAEGCGVVGHAEAEHSWFSGYLWQVAVCRGCGEHMGWLFRGDARFYGLILDRLVTREDKSL